MFATSASFASRSDLNLRNIYTYIFLVQKVLNVSYVLLNTGLGNIVIGIHFLDETPNSHNILILLRRILSTIKKKKRYSKNFKLS